MNEKMIDKLARAVAAEDEKIDAPYDELPYHAQLSCRAMARFVLRVVRRWTAKNGEFGEPQEKLCPDCGAPSPEWAAECLSCGCVLD